VPVATVAGPAAGAGSGKRGATMRSVTNQPSSVTSGVETIMKYQFDTGLTV
jgi:hypothetical protein